MFVVVALAFALQSKSLFGQIVAHPTGDNGYEEYLQAADLLRSPEAGVYSSWTPEATLPTKDPDDPESTGSSPAIVALFAHLKGLSPLDARREEREKYGRVLELIAQGNAKPAFDPREALGPDTPFPEFASFKSVTKFAVRAANVDAAEGKTDRATDVLLDQLTFADNFGRGVLIANLVNAACSSISFAAFDDLLPRLSRPDALKIERVTETLMARPFAIRAVVPAEMRMAKASVALTLASKDDLSSLFSETGDEKDPKAQTMAKRFAALSPESRSALSHSIEVRLDAFARRMDRVFDAPEKDWQVGVSIAIDEAATDPNDLGDALFAAVTPSYSGVAEIAVRQRTQLRLLALHAKLIEYRWNYGHYPASVDAVDPLTGGKYVYEVRKNGSVRLASNGTPETGEIELRYKRKTQTDPDVQP